MPELSVVATDTHMYRVRGSMFWDADWWSDKGVVRVLVETPDGARLDVYSTHLIAGGWGGEPRRPDRVPAARAAQLDELVGFVERTHDPADALVVTGDFNMEDGGREGERLTSRMSDLGLVDAWTAHGKGSGPTADVWALGDDGFASEPGNPTFCDDGLHHAEAVRIDYAFVGSGTATTLEVSTVRRRAWPRPAEAPEADAIGWLSDHAALHLELELDR